MRALTYIWIRGEENMVVWIVRFQSNISVYHQWIKAFEGSTSYQVYDGDEFMISKDPLNLLYH